MSLISNIPYHSLTIGQKIAFTRPITAADVALFAEVSGDHNPVHLDADFAASTPFKEPIAHGMLSGALISAGIACHLPGPGSIYLEQQVRFMRPVKLGDVVKVELEVLEKLPKNRVRLATRVFNQTDQAVVEGIALVIAPTEQQHVAMPVLPHTKLP